MKFYPGYQYVCQVTEFERESDLIVQKGLIKDGKNYRCQRCNTSFLAHENCLPDGRYYCRECLLLGRITSSHYLVTKPIKKPVKKAVTFCFKGKLTPAQEKISQGLVQNFIKQKNSLVYAVTGAGKTEMLFSLLCYCLTEGLTVAFCSPRVDVCCEIQPRLQQVFPKLSVGLRYYGAKPYEPTPLLVCTTHQLLYFKAAFHLIVVDEIDAFPYAHDKKLHFAVSNALHESGATVFLSATPSEFEIKKAQQQAGLFCLPARYHRRKLPVPKLVRIKKQALPLTFRNKRVFLQWIKYLLLHNHILLFCASISQLKAMEEFLKKEVGKDAVGSVHAADPKRQEKISDMRQNAFQIFCCSTILERGVTFSNVSVLVFEADHQIFTKATLLQIAGRADRKGEFSHSEVIFCFSQMTPALKGAIKEIKELNQKAQKAGLLNEV